MCADDLLERCDLAREGNSSDTGAVRFLRECLILLVLRHWCSMLTARVSLLSAFDHICRENFLAFVVVLVLRGNIHRKFMPASRGLQATV